MKCFYAMDNVLRMDDSYLFVSLYNNRIYRILDENLSVESVSQIPFSFNNGYMEYSKIYAWNNKLFILPWFSDSIAIYDISKNVYRFIKLNEECRGLRYLKAYQDNERLFLIPCENKDIAIVDMRTEKIEENVKIRVKKENEKKVIAWCEICGDEENITIPQVYDGGLIKYNYKKNQISYVENRIRKINGLCGICDTNGGRWYIPRKADIIYFEKGDVIKEFSEFPKGYIAGDISFYKIVPDTNRVFLLPRDANMLLIVNEDGTIQRLKNIKTDMKSDIERYMYFSNVWKMWDRWFCVESSSGNIYEISNDNNLVPKFFIERGSYKNNVDIRGVLEENPYHEYSLENFISSIVGE